MSCESKLKWISLNVFIKLRKKINKVIGPSVSIKNEIEKLATSVSANIFQNDFT